MCSEYQTKTSQKAIEAALGDSVINHAKDFDWGKTIKFFTEGPVIQKNEDGKFELTIKTFPSSPMPNSRLSGLEGQSDGSSDEDIDEAQIKRIYEMPRWKDGFKEYPLLIPTSQFTEFAYWGDSIGTAQGFRIPREEVMFIAGIAINPYTPKGPKFSGYSLLTHTANEQMLEYHHRLVVLLKGKVALGYLEDMTPQERFQYLIDNRYTKAFEVEKIRDMSKAWKGKVDLQKRKFENEMRYRKVLAANGVAA